MKSANISELKNRLSYYLRAVRRGESVLIRDRDRVIARIEPAGGGRAATSDEERLAELERRGIITRPKAPPFSAEELAARRVRGLEHVDIVGAVLKEREEGW